MRLDPVDVVRMNLRSTVSLTPLVESDAEIRKRDSVRIQALGLGSHDADKLGRKIQNLAEFYLLFTDSVFRPLPILDIGKDAIPFDNVASPVAQGDATLQMPAILPVRAAETYLVLERLAARSAREPFCVVSLEIIWMGCSLPTCSGDFL